MNYGFFRVACASPDLVVADCSYNAERIIDFVREAYEKKASLIVFPELCITGYTCADLFLQKTLQDSAIRELERIAKKTSSFDCIIAVGFPFFVENALYNCAAVLFKGKILCVIPKTFIPTYAEFYERRWFSPVSENLSKTVYLSEKNPEVPFGSDILICDSKNPDFVLAFELCEDLWVPYSPSLNLSLSGATVIANLSASNEIIGKAEYRRNLVKMQSAKLVCAYLYANAGNGESTQDMVFSGHSLICENGTILAESKLFKKEIIYSDIDVERLVQERKKMSTFSQCANSLQKKSTRKIYIDLREKVITSKELERKIDSYPFVPSEKELRTERCSSVIQLQAEALAKRLKHLHSSSCVLGLSGGLDSTLALLVTLRAFDICGFEKKGISAVTMPCFGTTDRTYKNACLLAQKCGATLIEVDIKESVRQHFKDIGHSEENHDVTYENAQARERTQVLMDIANKTGGIVIGTGDLSELALGWCTYNADQMSMYGVNSSVPKTLVRYLVEWFSIETDNVELSNVLKDILETPVSPELLPPKDGKIAQKTEELVGPYELHDFFLYYLLRFGFSPAKILYLADASNLPYNHDVKLKWLRIFYKRFFSQQFKRSCMPDGAKVGSINLSPRGDWRMPSDASSAIWLEEIDRLK